MLFIYITLLIVSVFFYILYEGVLSLMMLVFLTLMPIVLFIFNLYVSSKLSFVVSIDRTSSTIGQAVPVNIMIYNRSLIPVPSAEITIDYTVTSSRNTEQLKINTPIFPNNVQNLSTNFICEHLGTVNCTVKKVKLFDMLKLTRMNVRKANIYQDNNSVMIMPEAFELTNPIADYNDLSIDSDIFSPDKPGDDPSEIFAIREYADGDRMTRIHWKLTAKTDNLMVKDYSLPLTDNFLILVDTYISELSEDPAYTYDTIISLSFSLSSLLQENEKRHRVACYDDLSGDLCEMQVSDDQSLLDASAAILNCHMASQPDMSTIAAAAYDETNNKYGHLILVCSEFTDKASAVLSSSGLAARYTVLLCGSNNLSEMQSESSDIDIIPVSEDRIEQSIAEFAL